MDPVELAEDLARAAIDRLRPVVAQPASADGGDFHGEALAVGADQPGHVLALGREADLGKRAHPRLDADVDRVDERPVEVEQQAAGIGHRRRGGALTGFGGSVGGRVRRASSVGGRAKDVRHRHRRDLLRASVDLRLVGLLHDELA